MSKMLNQAYAFMAEQAVRDADRGAELLARPFEDLTPDERGELELLIALGRANREAFQGGHR